MRLYHNIASLDIYRTSMKVEQKQSIALRRISSGYKVNNAKDDPNVIAQSERLRMQIRGLQMAGRNVQDGVSMLQTAEGGLDGMTQMLQRVRELVIQAGSGSNTNGDKEIIQKEIDQMIEGIDSTVKTTEFNGKKLLSDGNAFDNTDVKSSKMAVGANPGESVDIPYYNLSSNQLQTSDGKKLSDMKAGGPYSIQGGNPIDDALNIVDNAINSIVSVRGKYGALENRFQDGLGDINEISDRIEGADSYLRDADIAEEMMEYSKDSILLEAGNAIMVQSNKLPQDALKILENVKSR